MPIDPGVALGATAKERGLPVLSNAAIRTS